MPSFISTLGVAATSAVVLGRATGTKKLSTNFPARVVATLHLIRLLLKRKWTHIAALATLFVPVKISPSSPKLTIWGHLLQLLMFRGMGYHLPPQVPLDMLVKNHVKYGPWKRHHMEREFAKRLGPIVGILAPLNNDYPTKLGRLFTFVSDPDMVEEVTTNKDAFPTRGHTGFNDVVKDGLLGMRTGDQWSRHRRVIGKFFSDKYLSSYHDNVVANTEKMFANWDKDVRDSKPTNVFYEFSMLTLDVILQIGWGATDEESNNINVKEADNEEMGTLDFVLKHLVLYTVNPLIQYLPTRSNKRVQEIRTQQRAEVEKRFKSAVDRLESGKSNKLTMLTAMAKATNPDGTPALSYEEIRDELSTIRGAGHETTSNTLCWSLYLLSRNPEKLRKLQEEADAVLGDSKFPSFQQLKDLKYTHMVMYEALRMFPTVPSFPRLAVKDTTVGGYDIPKGSLVFVSMFPLNHSTKVWDEPSKFEPERFEELPDLRPSKPVGVPDGKEYGFLPFGAGPRTCVGQRLAMSEGVAILSSIAKNYSWELADPHAPVVEVADITLGPKHGLNMNFIKRA